jgi:hypothetical protein
MERLGFVGNESHPLPPFTLHRHGVLALLVERNVRAISFKQFAAQA